MPEGTVGWLLVKLGVDQDGFKKGLNTAEGEAEKSTGRLKKIGLLAGGAVAAGLAAGVAGVAALVGKYKDLNAELFPAANRIGIATAELHTLRQVADHLGSEDGLEGVTDSAQELGLRLRDQTASGAYRADEALKQLGLSGARLRELSPKDALLETIAALQGVEDQQQKNWLADELFGGSWEHIAGILNVSTEEFAALTAQFGANEEALQKSLDATWKMEEAQARLGTLWEGLVANIAPPVMVFLTNVLEGFERFIPLAQAWIRELGERLMPVWRDELQPALMEMWRIIQEDLLPALQQVAEAVGPVLMPMLETLATFLKNTLGNAFQVIKGIILIVSGVLTGDFAKAWEGVQLVATAVANQVINVIEFMINRMVHGINAMISAAVGLLDRVPDWIPGAKGIADALRGARVSQVSFGRIEAPTVPVIQATNPAGGGPQRTSVPAIQGPSPSDRALTGGGGPTTVVNLYGDNYGDADLGEKVLEVVHEANRLG